MISLSALCHGVVSLPWIVFNVITNSKKGEHKKKQDLPELQRGIVRGDSLGRHVGRCRSTLQEHLAHKGTDALGLLRVVVSIELEFRLGCKDKRFRFAILHVQRDLAQVGEVNDVHGPLPVLAHTDLVPGKLREGHGKHPRLAALGVEIVQGLLLLRHFRGICVSFLGGGRKRCVLEKKGNETSRKNGTRWCVTVALKVELNTNEFQNLGLLHVRIEFFLAFLTFSVFLARVISGDGCQGHGYHIRVPWRLNILQGCIFFMCGLLSCVVHCRLTGHVSYVFLMRFAVYIIIDNEMDTVRMRMP